MWFFSVKVDLLCKTGKYLLLIKWYSLRAQVNNHVSIIHRYSLQFSIQLQLSFHMMALIGTIAIQFGKIILPLASSECVPGMVHYQQCLYLIAFILNFIGLFIPVIPKKPSKVKLFK